MAQYSNNIVPHISLWSKHIEHKIEDYIKEHEKIVEIMAYFNPDPQNKSYTKFENVNKYFTLVDSIDDKIYLAQNLCDFELAEKLFEEYQFLKSKMKKWI